MADREVRRNIVALACVPLLEPMTKPFGICLNSNFKKLIFYFLFGNLFLNFRNIKYRADKFTPS